MTDELVTVTVQAQSARCESARCESGDCTAFAEYHVDDSLGCRRVCAAHLDSDRFVPAGRHRLGGHAAQGRGGNLRMRAGRGGRGDGVQAPGGSIVFETPDGAEYLRIDPDGRAFMRGALVATDEQVYRHFVEWLSVARCSAEAAP